MKKIFILVIKNSEGKKFIISTSFEYQKIIEFIDKNYETTIKHVVEDVFGYDYKYKIINKDFVLGHLKRQEDLMYEDEIFNWASSQIIQDISDFYPEVNWYIEIYQKEVL